MSSLFASFACCFYSTRVVVESDINAREREPSLQRRQIGGGDVFQADKSRDCPAERQDAQR